jgi:hypothetical protein
MDGRITQHRCQLVTRWARSGWEWGLDPPIFRLEGKNGVPALGSPGSPPARPEARNRYIGAAVERAGDPESDGGIVEPAIAQQMDQAAYDYLLPEGRPLPSPEAAASRILPVTDSPRRELEGCIPSGAALVAAARSPAAEGSAAVAAGGVEIVHDNRVDTADMYHFGDLTPCVAARQVRPCLMDSKGRLAQVEVLEKATMFPFASAKRSLPAFLLWLASQDSK